MNAHTDIRSASGRIPLIRSVEEPIRSPLVHSADLRDYGKALAAGNLFPAEPIPEFDVQGQISVIARNIGDVVATHNAANQQGETITPAANWLLDNSHIVEEAISEVRRDLPPRFYRQLPQTDGARLPRVLAIAWHYVAQTDSAVSREGFEAIVDGFQDVEPLRIGELWALPSVLRFVLLENLRRLALRVERARVLRQLANNVADRLASIPDDDDIDILQDYSEYALDRSFATQLLHRLRDGSHSFSQALGWLERRLEEGGSDAEQITLDEHAVLSGGNVTTGNIIRGLRLIDDTDWIGWFEQVSRIDRMLHERTDFGLLDAPSRNVYRKTIEKLAKRSGLSEFDVATKAIDFVQARRETESSVEIGCALVGRMRVAFERSLGYKPPVADRLLRFIRAAGWPAMVVPVVLFTAIIVAVTASILGYAGLPAAGIVLLCLLVALPASEAALGLFNTLVALFVEPKRLIAYEYKSGIPAHARTMVAMPVILATRDDVDDAVHNLEVHYLSNADGEIHFALLSDWPDSNVERSDRDDELLDYTRMLIAGLNARYPKSQHVRFYLLHRHRLKNPSEDCWMGWERKRGKLHELNALLKGDVETTFFPPNDPLPDDVKYVMTVDADTRMTRDAVHRLVGKLEHPLNQPAIDHADGRILSGYGILQPRVTPSLTTGDEASFFQRIFSEGRGIDPYVFTVSDVYQDLFREGSFTGKGLYHIDAFEAALRRRIPENTILSHDLLEGAYARAALVSDIELIEDYPTRYLVDASRHHRWARGDWQLLHWIFSPRSKLPGLSRWKMIDNLRRSLMPITWTAASVAGWSLLPFASAAVWQLCLIVTVFFSLTLGVIDAFMPRTMEMTPRSYLASFGRSFAMGTAQVAMRLALMAHMAWSMGDAIARTLHRVFFTRKHLLEWRTASQVARAGTRSVSAHYRSMWGALVVGAAGLAIPIAFGSSGAVIAAVFALIWFASPAIAWLISRSAESDDRLILRSEDGETLRNIARRTWLYFETFVTEQHNFLPPDNFQETPAPVVAPRTSPTNIGLYFLSVVSARDFGWISLTETIERLEQTLTSLEKLERYRGHIYNWYDIETLKPLQPHYISAVDSGNLAGHLLAVASACRHWADAPAAYTQGDFRGILDVLSILEDQHAALPDERRSLRPLRQRMRERLEGMRRSVRTMINEPETATFRTIDLTVIAVDIKNLAGGLNEEIRNADSETIVLWANKLEKACRSHLADAQLEGPGTASLRSRLLGIGDRARNFAFGMDFSFLLNRERKLLSIGFRVAEQQLDESCYDLLASEARLASLFAIAKGDVPTEHWLRLGRSVTEIGFSAALLSWSGSMFEYLMPPLVMKEPLGGILDQSSHLIIRKQIAYGRSKRIPWGVSEAAYNARDTQMTYQYTNFGVPGLGLKRGLGQETVIAPYASLLAAQFRPAEAVENLKRLKKLGACGRYGFHDAVDFTPGRVPEGHDCAVVRNFMAHHHGMSIVAVANVVFEGRMRDRFHDDPVIEAAELLLQEKAPRIIPPAPIRSEASEQVKPAVVDDRPDSRLIENPLNASRAVNLMSNGHYHVMVTAAGTGYSRADEISVTRWSADPTEDRSGTFLFLRDAETGAWWSATAEPKRIEGEKASAFFCEDKATFFKTVGDFRSETECIVLGEGNGEVRRITLINDGQEERHIELTSFAEVALAFEAADSAHPAFSKMFVKTEIDGKDKVIFATRRKRSDGDPSIALAHFMTCGAGVARDLEAETDRRSFIGRGRSIDTAAAFDPGATLSGNAGHVMDPVMALRCKVRVPARKKISLSFWTVVAANRGDIEGEIRRFRYSDVFQRQAMLAWTRSQVQVRHVGLSLSEAAGVQKLARYLLYPDPVLRAQPETIAERLGPQSTLWPLSISGDFPIFVLRIGDEADIEIVASALRMQEYLRAHGLFADLVIVNEQASSYVQDLQNAIELLCDNARARGREFGPRQHIFTVRRDLADASSYGTLIASARIVMHTRNGTILDQIERAELTAVRDEVWPEAVRRAASDVAVKGDDTVVTPPDVEFWNGYGGFDDGGRDYVVQLTGDRVTPHPWINVIANPSFGFHSSAEGASFTWSRNSRDFQLTPWSNDPVTNRPGEAFYVHDLDTHEAFSPLACVLRDPAIAYRARHSRGVSQFEATRGDITAELTQLVDAVAPLKAQRLRLGNAGDRKRRFRIYAYCEWLLGNNRNKAAAFVIPGFNRENRVLTARNPYHVEYGDRVAFMASDARWQSVTADRTEFLGRGGATTAPLSVLRGNDLSGTIEAGRDPCAAIACDLEIRPGETVDILFVTGDAGSDEEAVSLAREHLDRDFDERLADNRRRWEDFGETLQVSSPDPAFDAMVNVWLPYQSLACRITARSAFYQASGAFGFRDQLQDTLALLLQDPQLARTQIINAAGRQFREGDVQHWWLPGNGAGVRTMISDDVVWLGYGARHYIHVTGDAAILDEEIAFLEGPELKEGEHDRFFEPDTSDEKASLYEHCARALDLAVSRTGESGVPLILGGDWNDGMNRVGEKGRGESVWLGWFLLKTLRDFAPIAESRNDGARARDWLAHAGRLQAALNDRGWDGEWYRRGSFDDGTPLGSRHSDECRIDSIAQSWAVLSGGGDSDKTEIAIDCVMDMLFDDKDQIIKLFTPPFEHTEKDPGYIKNYPPGVRENGGQYTHAAIWMVMALAQMGRADDAWRAFSMLNPVNHTADQDAADRYRVEPYVVAADIYSGAEKGGRGGWTWYTGSAGWLYRAAVEAILGIRREGDRLHIDPRLPSHWDNCSLTLKIGEARYNIEMRHGDKSGLIFNGTDTVGPIPLTDGLHEVRISVPRASKTSRPARQPRLKLVQK